MAERFGVDTTMRACALALLSLAVSGAARAQDGPASDRGTDRARGELCVNRQAEAGWGIGHLDPARRCTGFETRDAAARAVKYAATSEQDAPLQHANGAVQLAVPFSTQSSADCKTTDGAYASTSLAFFPTCYGLFAAATPRFLSYATRGTNPIPGSHPPVPSPETNGLAQVLIQGKTQSSVQSEQLLTLNYDVDRGAPTSASVDKVALQLYMNCHKSRDGRYRPGACWAFNPDIRFEQGAGPIFGTIAEFDMNLADEFCGPNAPSGPGCVIYSLWFNGFNLYPQTATIRMEGVPASYAGTVDVDGSVLSTSKPFGNSLSPGFNADTTTIYINNVICRVQRVLSPTKLQLAVDLGRLRNVPAYWQPHTTKDAILITGDNYAATSVMQANTSAYYGITLGGNNVIALDVSRNSTKYGLLMASQQRITFNGFDDYQIYAGHDEHQFSQNGQVTFAIDGVHNAADWLGVTNSGTDTMPTLSARGFDSNVDLGLRAKGDGTVAVLSKALALSPTTIAALPACNAKSKGWIAYVSDPAAHRDAGFNAVVAGGGSTPVNHLAGCDGINWRYQ